MNEILRITSLGWCLIHILVLFILFYRSRYGARKTLAITLSAMIPLVLVNLGLFWILGREIYGQLMILTLVLPSFLFFFIMAENRDFRFVFTFCLVDTVSAEIIILSMLLDVFLGGDQAILLFIFRILSFPVLEYLAIRKLRQSYLEIQRTLDKGWGAFSLVSVMFYALLLWMACYPELITDRPADVPAMVMMLVLMPLMYLNIFQVLANQNKIHTMQREQELMLLQARHMNERMHQTAETEERIRIERHDLRHRLLTVGSMLEKGEYEEAMKYVSDSTEHLDAAVAKRWCANPALDAVFSYYFRMAEGKHIRIEAALAVPTELSVDMTELSIALANALENAIHACEKLPESRRVINCRCVNSPQVMFQISNPFEGSIRLDEEGRPVSTGQDHGIGTRSILAFCEKHGAYVDYKIEEKRFSIRIVLPG